MFGKTFYPLFLVLGFSLACNAPRNAQTIPAKPQNPDTRLAKLKLVDLDGKPVSLADFAGKPVFLNFWATWCGPCVSEMASIEKASQQLGPDMVFIAASNESPAVIRSYLRKNKFSFKFVQLVGTYLDVFVVALPTTMLIDAQGRMVAEEEGFRNWASPNSIERLKSMAKK